MGVPSVPEDSASLWRYMSLAKFCSMLESEVLFFALVGDMIDKYEGFIYPPMPLDESEYHLWSAQWDVRDRLAALTKQCLISCWVESEYESYLMWETYAGTEGLAIRTTFGNLYKSLNVTPELPITFGRVKYVDYDKCVVPRLGAGPLFHKRIEYHGESELRAVLPGPPLPAVENPALVLDLDVENNRGRYIPVNLDILFESVILPPNSKPWFEDLVGSLLDKFNKTTVSVLRSSMEYPE